MEVHAQKIEAKDPTMSAIVAGIIVGAGLIITAEAIYGLVSLS
jgi:hypothetical protein